MSKRTLKTRLCDMLGIDYPILSAGMGPTLMGEETGAPVELVVAVSEAGGMGVLGGSGFTVDELRQAIREIKSRTKKPFGVDLLLPKNLDLGAGTGMEGVNEMPIREVLKMLPPEHRDWIDRVKEELGLPEPVEGGRRSHLFPLSRRVGSGTVLLREPLGVLGNRRSVPELVATERRSDIDAGLRPRSLLFVAVSVRFRRASYLPRLLRRALAFRISCK